MKNIIFLLLVLILFAGCKSSNKASEKDSLADSTTHKNPSAALIEQFKPIIQGNWVNKAFVDAVAATKSPLKAYKKAANITAMNINTAHIRGNSLLIEVGYGNHEGGNLIIKFLPGISKKTILTYNEGGDVANGFYELTYDISGKSTILKLYTYGKKKKITDSAEYIKVFDNLKDKDLGYATYNEVNKILVSGSYNLIDPLAKNVKVNFTDDGEVSGIEGFKTFSINIDFTVPPNNVDEIIFDSLNNKTKSYTFSITADTLNLFETSYSKDSLELIPGKLKYQLVRQK